MAVDYPQPAICCLDALDADAGPDANSNTLALDLDVCDCIGVHRGQELRQRLENGDVCAGACINMPELQRDDAAADENH